MCNTSQDHTLAHNHACTNAHVNLFIWLSAAMNNIKKTSSFVHEGGGDYDNDYGTFEDGSSSRHQ